MRFVLQFCTHVNMPGTSAGATHSAWHAAPKQCARVYNEGKKAETKPAPKAAAKPAGKSACACKDQTKAEKTREVDTAVKKERVATKARQAQSAKDLRDDAARIQKAINKTEEPARRAHQQKLAAHVRETKKGMDDQATAQALAKVQARRRLATQTAA